MEWRSGKRRYGFTGPRPIDGKNVLVIGKQLQLNIMKGKLKFIMMEVLKRANR